jgi:hypothetical protein
LQLDVFVQSDSDCPEVRALSGKQAPCGEKVLVHEAYMNSFDPDKLGWIQNEHREDNE